MSPHRDHDPMTTREEFRLHLVAEHHWPAVARYDATAEDLDSLHRDMHGAAPVEATVHRIRTMLNMD